MHNRPMNPEPLGSRLYVTVYLGERDLPSLIKGLTNMIGVIDLAERYGLTTDMTLEDLERCLTVFVPTPLLGQVLAALKERGLRHGTIDACDRQAVEIASQAGCVVVDISADRCCP